MSLLDFGKERIQNARNPKEEGYLENLWAEKPVALFFLRRLGCPICRSYIEIVEKYREEIEKLGVSLVCLSFEAFGEGSDKDRTFEKHKFWNGQIYTIHKKVYEELFGRKGFLDNFYGLLDMDKEAYERSKKTPGNMKGDGFQLGGQYVVQKGGKVKLEHKQKLFGDDAKLEKIVEILKNCVKELKEINEKQ